MELLKKPSVPATFFKTVMTDEKFTNSECYKINRKHFLPKY